MLDVRSLLSRMTYQPNVEITYSPSLFDQNRPTLHIVMWVLNARQRYPREPREVQRLMSYALAGGYCPVCFPRRLSLATDSMHEEFRIPQPQRLAKKVEIPWQIWELDGEWGEHLFYEWLSTTLREMILHEHGEWFQVDGKPFRDPHKPSLPVKKFDESLRLPMSLRERSGNDLG